MGSSGSISKFLRPLKHFTFTYIYLDKPLRFIKQQNQNADGVKTFRKSKLMTNPMIIIPKPKLMTTFL